MRRDARAYLWDIDRAASAIERFIDGLDIPPTRRTNSCTPPSSESSKSSASR